MATPSEGADSCVYIDEVARFCEEVLGYSGYRARYNARSVFYYFVEHVSHVVIVCCTSCKRRYGTCRCSNRGGDVGLGWTYSMFLDAAFVAGERNWVISRASLMVLDPERIPVVRNAHRRHEHVLAFLRHVQQK